MKNILLTFVVIIGFSTGSYSQEYNTTTSYDEVEIGTVVNGNLVSISSEIDSSTVVFRNDTIEIVSGKEKVILTDVEFIGNENIHNIDIQRYQCKNPSGEIIICSVADGVISIFNIENNFVETHKQSDYRG
ncbi:MAG: hypothetical protein KAG14_03445 [Mycoplasmataceae bacterium]|nr:hypothetical protein [Mycoplasmataceae bacterium]